MILERIRYFAKSSNKNIQVMVKKHVQQTANLHLQHWHNFHSLNIFRSRLDREKVVLHCLLVFNSLLENIWTLATKCSSIFVSVSKLMVFDSALEVYRSSHCAFYGLRAGLLLYFGFSSAL